MDLGPWSWVFVPRFQVLHLGSQVLSLASLVQDPASQILGFRFWIPVHLVIITKFHKRLLSSSMFLESLKLADATPIYKKSDPTLVSNYRPTSVLPTMSKVFGRLMHHQVSEYIDKHLLPFLCGYRKGFNTQTALLSLLEKWKSTLDKKGFCRGSFNGPLKSFRYN